MLFRCDADSGGHLPALAVLTGITHGGDHGRGCHRTHTTQLLQAHAVFVVRGQSLNYLIHLTHSFIQTQQVTPHAMQQGAEVIRQAVLGIFQPTRDRGTK